MKFDEGCEVYLDDGNVKNLLILFHGYGSNGNDMMQVGYFVSDNLLNTVFIAPNGFENVFGIDDGYKWFDIPDLKEEEIYKHMIKNKDKFLAYIDFQVKKFGVSYDNLILAGFSQGACVAIYSSLIIDKKIKAVVGLSGGLPCVSKILSEIKCSQKILLVHGKQDEVLDYSYSVNAFDALKKIGLDVSLSLIDNLGHSVNNESLNEVKSFLSKI